MPVFVDVQLPTYNIDADLLEAALSPRTKAIMIAHTLGNPFDLDKVAAFARKHGLWLVEDCCDALGSTFNGRKVGTFGDIGTLSFYPAHHITMGEGGAVFTRDPQLRLIMESVRDWAATAIARRARTIPAASAFPGSWANCPAATTTSTPIPTWGTT
ncbi:L-glutamine:2-deoxy-scyllo-inosose aminotransferase [Chromobacterium violaceum]|uniref:L-glutamine:2-deoxy-scyllo-inosose aminotransferase n=1 Tax=Chromobacterium violaceum TaxID=536 RepID=A0A3S4IJM2_CHRVL|nr:L-glutamine:2-deoxy-scyllo-inosose aminotransferase [Chromobacterium violaceum]